MKALQSFSIFIKSNQRIYMIPILRYIFGDWIKLLKKWKNTLWNFFQEIKAFYKTLNSCLNIEAFWQSFFSKKCENCLKCSKSRLSKTFRGFPYFQTYLPNPQPCKKGAQNMLTTIWFHANRLLECHQTSSRKISTLNLNNSVIVWTLFVKVLCMLKMFIQSTIYSCVSKRDNSFITLWRF